MSYCTFDHTDSKLLTADLMLESTFHLLAQPTEFTGSDVFTQ